jgi:hypothetical protein
LLDVKGPQACEAFAFAPSKFFDSLELPLNLAGSVLDCGIPGALDNGPLKQWIFGTAFSRKMMENGTSSGRNAHGCNLVLVSAYIGDVFLHPFERRMLVPKTDIWNSLPLYCWTAQETIDTNLGESDRIHCNEKRDTL